MYDLRCSFFPIRARRSQGTQIVRSLAIASALFCFLRLCEGGEDLLIRAVVDGRKTSLYEKVVVVSGKATLADKPAVRGEPIEPFAIFFKLRTDDGQAESQGYVRVGASDGTPKGWIKKSDVRSWNSRFVLEPLQPVPGRTFSVDLGGDTRADLDTVAEGKRRFALITEAVKGKDDAEEPAYPVVVYAGNVQSLGAGGTIARERNTLRDLKLEVVFVIESTDFMLGKFDDVVVGDSVKGVINHAVKAIKSNPSLADAVRLGLVEYQDTSKLADFDARLSSPLTGDLDKFLERVYAISPKEIKGDWAEDGLAGINTAVNDAGWSENSSKHVIVFGCGSYQIYPKGSGPNPLGGTWNSLTKLFDRSNPDADAGWNSTGLSIQQLIARAHPQGGSAADKARNAKTIHTLLGGREIAVDPKFKDLATKIVTSNDAELEQWIQAAIKVAGSEKEGIGIIVTCFQLYQFQYQRTLALQQYKELARNDGVEGLFLTVEPNADAIKHAADELSRKLDETFKTIDGTRSGDIGKEQLKANSNELTRTFYAIVGAAADKFKDEPVLSGAASVRDQRGREVAQKKVLVSKQELQRLRSSLDAIHKKFLARVAKADRQDASKILTDLKQITAQTGAGQTNFAEDAKLKDIITDLPLRTTILETTPRDIAVMDSDTFKQWLNKIEAAIFRVDDLLGGNAKTEWLELSSVAQNDRFTFLRLNELP